MATNGSRMAHDAMSLPRISMHQSSTAIEALQAKEKW
jgi:hypothetical protein